METKRPGDFAEVIAGLLILAYMVGCPIVILIIATNR